MGDRSRLRVGRGVLYTPTLVEAAAQGEGPWAAKILRVNAGGTVDLHVFAAAVTTAVPAALADPLVTSPDGSDAGTTQTLANELKADVNTLTTLVNAMREETVGARRTGVALGGMGGQFSLEGVTAI